MERSAPAAGSSRSPRDRRLRGERRAASRSASACHGVLRSRGPCPRPSPTTSRGRRGAAPDGQTLADIFLGKITKWNDPAIAKLNAGATLPSTDITLAYRATAPAPPISFRLSLEGSPEWKSKVGVATSVNLPTGVGGRATKASPGLVEDRRRAIGYVGAAYAQSNDFNQRRWRTRRATSRAPTSTAISGGRGGREDVPSNNAHLAHGPAGLGQGAYPTRVHLALVPSTRTRRMR